uniref:receptor-type tyrosine-protein phosphatase H-like n=1 Tax=Semicossyphus pulcher TaxID=241346 RepID=UPI0037E84A90
MKPLSFKITSDRLLLCVFLSLLWGVSDSSTTSAPVTTVARATVQPTTTPTAPSTTIPPPKNVKEVNVLNKTESNITLTWDSVDGISTYFLKYTNNDKDVERSISDTGPNVEVEVTALTAGTKYNFTVITTRGGLNSSGFTFEEFTSPRNAEAFKAVDQSETSITLQWHKTENILYTLKFGEKEQNFTVSAEHPVIRIISELTNTNKYDFTLFTVFENVRSSGVNTTAATAPRNAEEFKSDGQNETSITLQWKKVGAILSYTLMYNDNNISVSASAEKELVRHGIHNLTSGTRYDFSLFTVFEDVTSSGVNHIAVTAPRNTEELKVVDQNENSITLQWTKVDDLNYTLVYGENERNFSASEEHRVTISNLTHTTKYNFTLFTVFENVRSSGVLTPAATAPPNTETFESAGQNENSITLQWKKVGDLLSYALEFKGKEINVSASKEQDPVTHTIPDLMSGTKYVVRLFSLFESIKSSGRDYTAATVPSMVASVNVSERSVDSVTLMWENSKKNWGYRLQINGEDIEPDNSTDLVSHSVTSLDPGSEYPFKVTTVFFGHNSTAYEDFTVTKINCASETWHVTNSSIRARVEGLFSNATATNGSHTHVSPEGSDVSFTGLYPGETYNVSLVYVKSSRVFPQCDQSVTINPSDLIAHCEHWAAGYSVFITWGKPAGVWTEVQVNVSGKTEKILDNETQHIIIPGFLPAKTYRVSVWTVSGPRWSAPYVFTCATDPRGVIAGSVMGVLLFVALVCLVAFILLRRPDIISRNKPSNGGSKQTDTKSKAISVEKFPDHFHQLGVDENRGFSLEYESLLPVGTEQTHRAADIPENRARNRFNNVLPYDWCRVKLTTSDDNETSDYINASYMPGYNNIREYIATQGPLPSTVSDFWRMIWEQRVNCIVMVTNCTESGKTKCEQYWPGDSKPRLCGELSVTLKSEQQEANWTLREFTMKRKNTSEERTVKHFHFTAWPDHGVPQGTEVLIQFRGLVRQHIQREGTGAPTVVHCSAGVGRTGTIISLDVLLQQLEKERAVGIYPFVHKMRLSRPHMVQTESQYVFLHHCIMDRLLPNETIEENIYENDDMLYVNATALREFTRNSKA